MPYGILKVDTITFTAGGVDTSVSISGLVQNPTFTGNITSTGTISGNIIRGGTTVSGATVTGTAGQFGTLTGNTAGFTTVTGTTVTGATANFTTLSGTTATITSGVFASGTAAAPSVSVGTTTNGLFSSGANEVAISTGGSGRLFVDASGNVGAGTSSPAFAAGGGIQAKYATFSSFRATVGANTGTDFSAASDGKGYVYVRDNADLLIGTNNTERLRITAAGLVGVGVSSPSELLHLGSGGKIRLNRADNATGSTISDGGSNNGIIFNSLNNDGFTFQNNGTTVFKIDTAPNGNRVGIGTSSPSYLLDASGSGSIGIRYKSTGAYGTIVSDNSSATGGGLFIAQQNGSTKASFGASGGIEGNTSSDAALFAETGGAIRFYTNGSATAKAILDSTGRLGIGSTTVGARLHVSSGASSASISANADDLFVENNGNAGITIGSSNTALASIRFTDPESNGPGIILYNHSDNSLAFTVNDSERFRCDSSGRVLVGTSSTSAITSQVIQGNSGNTAGNALLTLARGTNAPASGNSLGAISFSDSNHGQSALISADRDGGTWTSGSSQPSRLVFSTTADGASSPTERMRITQAGGVRLPDVYNQTIALSANVFIDTDGTLKRATSSIKYKTNVETLEDQYADAVLNCRPVWYQSTSAGDNPNWGFWGFIAEEVAEIDPRLVQWKTVDQVINEDGSRETIPLDTPEPENVAYDRFVPHLLNLIKRQQQAIEDLQAEVAALKAQ